MTSKIFASQGDFASRVTDTVVFFKGDPFYARPSQDKAYHLDLLDFPQTNKTVHKAVWVDDEALYIGAARLGLFNHEGTVFNPTRVPARRYRYGTPPEFLRMNRVSSSGASANAFNQGFRNMLLNEYPSVQEALKAIRDSKGTVSVAISRHFWLKENQLGLLQLQFKDMGAVLWMDSARNVTFVEKTTLSRYLTLCSPSLQKIIKELKTHVV